MFSRKEIYKSGGRDYEIRVDANDSGLVVRAFRGDCPANQFTYTISWDAKTDFEHYLGHGSAVEQLVELAKHDLDS